MRKIEKLLLGACGYTVLTAALFYTVALIGEFKSATLGFGRFALIFAFGIIISAAGMLLSVKAIKLPVRIIIHYGVLLAAFCFIFILSGNLGTAGSSVVFTAVVVFTFLYALIFALTYLIRRAVKAADDAIEKKDSAKNSTKHPQKKKYTPLYKDGD